MAHRRLGSKPGATNSTLPSSSTNASSRARRPTELEVDRPGSDRAPSRGAKGNSATLSVEGFTPDPSPSPSKFLNHPTYAPCSRLLRQQQTSTGAASTNAYFPNPSSSTSRAPLDSDAESDSDSEEYQAIGLKKKNSLPTADDATDYAFSPPPGLTIFDENGMSPPSSPSTSPESRWGSFNSAKNHLDPSPSNATGRFLSPMLTPERKRGGLLMGQPPPPSPGIGTMLSWMRAPPASPVKSNSSFSLTSHLRGPRRPIHIVLVVGMTLMTLVLFSHLLQAPSPKLGDIVNDPSILTESTTDYDALLAELKKGGREITPEEKKLLELEKMLEQQNGIKGMMGRVAGKFEGIGQGIKEMAANAVQIPGSVGKTASTMKGGKGTKKKGGKGGKATVTVTPAGNKKPSGKSNILGLDQIPRRYRYGSNLQPAKKAPTLHDGKESNSQDTSSPDDEDAEENDNALVSVVPTEEQLQKIFKVEKERYESEEPFWRSFKWDAPPVHDSLKRVIALLDKDEISLRNWILEMRKAPRPPAFPVGLAAKGPTPSPPTDPNFDRFEAETADEDEEDDDGPIVRVEDVPADPSVPEYIDVVAAVEEEEGEEVDVMKRSTKANTSNKRLRRRRLPGSNRLRPAPPPAMKGDRSRKPSASSPSSSSSTASKPLRQLGMEDFVGGSLVKWGALMQESREELGGTCGGAKWLQDYQALHDEMLTGEREAKLISYSCERGMNCGGLGDRILGMTSAFFFGLVTNRAFLAEWQTPIPLDVIFDSPFLDWSFSSFTLDRHPVLSNRTLQDAAADLDIIHFDKTSMDATFGTAGWSPSPGKRMTKGMERRDLAFASPWIKLFTNRGMVYRSFSYGHLQNRIEQLGLRPLTAFSCILNYLFRPKPVALSFISQYTSVMSLPSVFSVGIQIRTGDASMKDPDYDQMNTVEVHKNFFKCADQIADTYALPDQKVVYYLVTDSAHLREDAQRKFSDKVVISGAGIEHIHVKSGHADGVMSAVLEDWILAKADYRVITQDSGFGKLATFASGSKSTTVTIFPSQNLDVVGLLNKNSHVKVDCRLESAFSSFDELASEWSLG